MRGIERRLRPPGLLLCRHDTGPRPAGAVWAAAAVILAVLPSGPARATELPPMRGGSLFSAPGREDKRLSIFVGAAWGIDSNYNLVEPGSEESRTLLEGLGGFVLKAGNYHRKFELSGEVRADYYPDVGQTVVRESRVSGGLGTYSERLQINLRAKYADLLDPVEIGSLTKLERTQFAYGADLALSTGRTELGLSYVTSQMRYDDVSVLDFDDVAFSTELRWWWAETRQIFVHYDLGSIDYATDVRSDFGYTRLYGGIRLERPERLGLEFGVGGKTVGNFARYPSLSTTSLFALVRATLITGGGNSSIEVDYAVVDEASVTSTYKTLQTVGLRLRRASNRRFGWSIGVRSEQADFFAVSGTPDPSALSRIMADAGINLNVGSLDRAHGRIYLTVAWETRKGQGSSGYEYERLRAVVGVALVR